MLGTVASDQEKDNIITNRIHRTWAAKEPIAGGLAETMDAALTDQIGADTTSDHQDLTTMANKEMVTSPVEVGDRDKEGSYNALFLDDHQAATNAVKWDIQLWSVKHTSSVLHAVNMDTIHMSASPTMNQKRNSYSNHKTQQSTAHAAVEYKMETLLEIRSQTVKLGSSRGY